jgi:hypothetical protein
MVVAFGQVGFNMLAPHVWHCMSAVWVIRAIVW